MRFYLIWCVLVGSLLLFAAVLPEHYDMKPAPPGVRPIDGTLEKWINKYADPARYLEMEQKKFQASIQDFDEAERLLLELRYENTHTADSKESLEKVRHYLRSSKQDSHLLLPYLLEEFIESDGITPAESEWAMSVLDSVGGLSCPRKSLVLSKLSEGFGSDVSLKKVKSTLRELSDYRSRRFRVDAFDSFLNEMPVEFQADLRQEIFDQVRNYKEILDDNTWLLEDAGATKNEKKSVLAFKEAEKRSGRHQCRTAKLKLLEGIKAGDSGDFAVAQEAADEVSACFRRKGRIASERFWEQVQGQFGKSYGFIGEEFCRRKVGLLSWSRDDFEKSRGIFERILADAKREKNKEVEAETIFTIARIDENEGKIEKSLVYYKQYIEEFADGPRYLEALKALVLLYSVTGDFKQAFNSAEKILQSQIKQSIDDQSTGTNSFALFWAGRLSLSLGNEKLAEEMWRRVASEYYSTFYGALGHYMLEKLIGKSFQLAPARGRRFDIESYYSKFDARDMQLIRRSEQLLKIGFKEEASCEIAELIVPDEDKEKTLVKALFQHATGDWLASIKNFDLLPRSYRHSLPVGFERILFPRAYVESIKNYAGRLGVDADLVFAIIRQESVFNPKAVSGAGARGLMQLMPGTAKGEARRLGAAYLPKADRYRIGRSARDRNNLLDAETNIVLGVHHVYRLLKKHGNPIFLLTTYNANPRATKRWKRNIPTTDYLAFIERIPYRETQLYVKLVLRNYFYYKRWYREPGMKLTHLDSLASNFMKIKKTNP